jgi:hypothetical protein
VERAHGNAARHRGPRYERQGLLVEPQALRQALGERDKETR